MKNILQGIKAWAEKTRSFAEKYERHISSAALVAGFVIDSLTLRRIDRLFENAVFASYLIVAAIGIAVMSLYEGGYLKAKFFERIHAFLPFAIQFAFGGLASGFLIFYFRSSSLASSWLFIAILAGLFIGNEAFKKYYVRMVFTMSVLFFLLFLFLIFYLPIVFGRMGDGIFLLSGALSLALIFLYVLALWKFIPHRIWDAKRYLIMSIGGTYLLINVLYFLNIIPPIPLALKNIGIYHSIVRTGSSYSVADEVKKKGLLEFRDTIRVAKNEPIYAYSAVFAPTDLSANIVHHWRSYDEVENRWVTKSRIIFPIIGGRDRGYRGYSYTSNVSGGLWEVRVETAEGKIIGSKKFNIENVAEKVPLETKLIF